MKPRVKTKAQKQRFYMGTINSSIVMFHLKHIRKLIEYPELLKCDECKAQVRPLSTKNAGFVFLGISFVCT